MRREEKPTRCHWMVYFTYNMLNMFRALLCPSSLARACMCVITAYGVWCLGCWLFEVRCRAAGYASGMKDVARLESSNIPHPGRIAGCSAPELQEPVTKTSHTIGGNNTHNFELLMMGTEVPETCWAYYKRNKLFNGIQLVFLLYAYVTMHGQTHIKNNRCLFWHP